MILFFLHITLAVSAHTIYYNQNWTGNNHQLFFDIHTVGYNIFSNPCEIMTNKEFRDHVNKIISCNETWCVRGKYSCPSYVFRNCYEVEHIYDLNRPEYNKYKNIVGNRVMAWGKWNGALGRLSFNDSLNEKYNIYGHNIMIESQRHINRCRRRHISSIVLIVVGIFSIISISIYFIYRYIHKPRVDDYRNAQILNL